jgi:hypothetical protein
MKITVRFYGAHRHSAFIIAHSQIISNFILGMQFQKKSESHICILGLFNNALNDVVTILSGHIIVYTYIVASLKYS